MKATEKAALIGAGGGIALGILVAFAPVDAPWWVPVLLGAFVGGGLYEGVTRSAAAERAANGGAQDKR